MLLLSVLWHPALCAHATPGACACTTTGNDLLTCVEEGGVAIDDFYHAGTRRRCAREPWRLTRPFAVHGLTSRPGVAASFDVPPAAVQLQANRS